jgi:hypothetical protein
VVNIIVMYFMLYVFNIKYNIMYVFFNYDFYMKGDKNLLKKLL